MAFQFPLLGEKRQALFVGGVLILIGVAVGATTFYFRPSTAPVTHAAACPFIDNDANDGDASVGTYSLNTNFTVPSSTTAYDCTSGAGITTFIVPTGKTMTLDSDTSTGDIAAINFTNLQVDNGGAISSDGLGCPSVTNQNGTGPNGSNVCVQSTAGYGHGGSGSAGYGGAGGSGPGTAGVTYGSATAPTLFGSGGGGLSATGTAGSPGGGVVRLNITGTFTNNGTVSSNGVDAPIPSNFANGAGSGGSVYITTATFNGSTGTFKANGGNGGNGSNLKSGGAGGGRIAITYTGGSFPLSSSAFFATGGTNGGGGTTAGGKGTVYVRNSTTSRVDIFEGFTYTDTDYNETTWNVDPSATDQYCDTSIGGGATPSVTATNLTFGGALGCTQSITSFNWTTPNTFTISPSSSLSVNGNMSLHGGTAFSLGDGSTIAVTKTAATLDLDIPNGNNQTWTNDTFSTAGEGSFTMDDVVALTLAGTTAVNANATWANLTDLTIAATASISANGLGCPSVTSQDGKGPDGSNVCTQSTAGYGHGGSGSASYGGTGGSGQSGAGAPGVTYGSATAPTLFGSGGGGLGATATAGASGGGLVRLNITGTFTNDGTISANGVDAPTPSSFGNGAGSGGSVFITTATFNGSTGTFKAIGGSGGNGNNFRSGGAGGGRIAITYTGGTFPLSSSAFLATGGANGGGSTTAGGKGTVYLRNTATSRVDIFEGFTYADTDYNETTWNVDPSATNQYCDSSIGGGATPSVTATNLTFGGALNCTQSITSFNWTTPNALTISTGSTLRVNGAMSLHGGTAFSLGDGSTIAVTKTGATLDIDIPNGNNQTWTNDTFSNAGEGSFTMDDAVSVNLAGTTAVNANAQWLNLTNLTIASSASISANGLGCPSVTNQDGKGPDGSNVCIQSTAGYGAGGSGAAGYGGAGGTGQGGAGAPGVTYGSASAPTLFGSGGGGLGATGTSGSSGGGLVHLNIVGTFTNNGTVSANGVDAPVPSGFGNGAGSGGSVFVSTSAYVCATAPVFSAKGGAGGAGGNFRSGGGGGGRIRIEYVSDTCSAQPLSSLTVASVVTGGASGGGSTTAGSDGSLSVQNTDDPPAFSSAVSASPSNPNVNQTTTVSATATDDHGVNRIQLYLDGTTDPANVIKTCTFSPAQSPATCSIAIGPNLTDGPHTIRAAARDTASQTTNSDGTFTVGSFTTAGNMTLSRLKAGTTGVDFDLNFHLTGPDTHALTVTFPSGFTVTQPFTSGTCSGGGTVDSFVITSPLIITGQKTGCIGTVTLLGAKITLPNTPGTYVVTWSNDSGSGGISVVDDDSISLTANVDPVLTFDLDLSVADAESPAPYALDFGSLTPGTVFSSGTTFKSIWIDLSTNASHGATVTIKNLNGTNGLVSSSTPADKIPNSTASMSSTTANYGVCVVSVTQTQGALEKAGSYTSGTCTSNGTTNAVKALSTSAASILDTTTAPIDSARARLSVNVNATSVTPAHTDYTDTLTFIATGTY